MHYQIKSKRDFQTWINPIRVAYPYTSIEFRELGNLSKLLVVAAQNQGWKNASNIGFNFFQKIYYRNITVRCFLEYHKISKENIESFLEEYHTLIDISPQGNEKLISLDKNQKTIINFFVLSKSYNNIIVDTRHYHLAYYMAISNIIDNFVNNGGQCIRVQGIHYDKIREAFEEYRTYITDINKFQLLYFTDIFFYWVENDQVNPNN